MHISAYAVIRGLFEDSLCISAIYQDWESFRKMLQEDNRASRRKQMIYIIKTQSLEPEIIAKLNTEIKKFGKTKTLDMKSVAELGPLEKQYLWYQIISSNASHCSADSLRSQISVSDEKGGWFGFKHGPSDKGAVDAALWSACSAVIPSALAYCEIVGDKESQSLVSAHALKFQTMPSQELEMIRSFRENT